MIRVKGFGYLIQCLMAGMATSVAGMLLRSLDHRREQRAKRA